MKPSDLVDQTKGQARIGVGRIPAHSDNLDTLKVAFASLIDLIEDIEVPTDETAGEIHRLKSLAQTDIESAASWAEKAMTRPLHRQRNSTR